MVSELPSGLEAACARFFWSPNDTTQMETSVLSSGARELFYTPLQAETIAASCAVPAALKPEDAEGFEARQDPIQRPHNDVGVSLRQHSALRLSDRSSALIDPSAKTEAVQAVRPRTSQLQQVSWTPSPRHKSFCQRV